MAAKGCAKFGAYFFVIFLHHDFIMGKTPNLRTGTSRGENADQHWDAKLLKARQNATSHLHLESASVTNTELTSEVHSGALGLFQ